MKEVLTVKQILLFRTLRNVLSTVWRKCILILRYKGLNQLGHHTHHGIISTPLHVTVLCIIVFFFFFLMFLHFDSYFGNHAVISINIMISRICATFSKGLQVLYSKTCSTGLIQKCCVEFHLISSL